MRMTSGVNGYSAAARMLISLASESFRSGVVYAALYFLTGASWKEIVPATVLLVWAMQLTVVHAKFYEG